MIFHTTVFVYAVSILHKKEWLPWFLGGADDTRKFVFDYPFTELDPECYMFMLITLGQPLQMIFELFFVNERTHDFYEFVLHHIVHTFLIFSCIVANGVNMGTLTLTVHASTDIFLQSSKIINLLGHMRGPGFGVFGLAHVTWIYSRLFSYPMVLFTMKTSLSMSMRPEFSSLSTYLTMNDTFFMCILGLNYYWYYMIVSITWRVLSKGEVKDTHLGDKLE